MLRRLKMDTQQRINLGQAKNQAVEKLKKFDFITFEDYKLSYKEWVRNFYEWNNEVDAEFLETKGGDKEGIGFHLTPDNSNSQPHPSANIPTQLSDKQKRCPQCRMAIPKTWKRHEACGWTE
jgi:hypothetical protein